MFMHYTRLIKSIGFFILLTHFSLIAASQIKLPITLPVRDTTKKDSVKPRLPRTAIKSYADVVNKNFASQDGLFKVHQYKDTVYFEIPQSLFGRDIMVINRLSKGPGGYGMHAGEELDQKTIRFEKGPDSSVRVRYTLVINEADSSSSIYKAVVSSSLDPLVNSFPIKAYSKDSASFVIDVSKFLKDKSFVNSISNTAALSKGITYTSMKEVYIESIHAYPINVEITISKNFDSRKDPGSPVTVESHTSFIALPEKPMQRRYFDPRVGYFADYLYAYGDDQQKSEVKNFILRWRLEPKKEDLAKWKRGVLVEPAKPIVIYIDPATPKQWRPYLIQGINDWQKAFEQAGFKKAIIGKEWPENDTTMHLEDARYSMLNYFPSEVMNAYGPNVHDPRSGEIIQTHIGWYHNVMSLLHNWYMVQAAATDPAARKPKFDQKLMGELVRFVSSHEVGHTLGLRHNFGSSSRTPVDSLRSRRYLDAHGHTASIMDYARFNYVAQPEDNIPQRDLFPRIGEYDRWAIEWGYGYSGAKNADDDQQVMAKRVSARLAENPRLWFGDGETVKTDPRNQTEDLGDDAVKASAYGIKNLQRIVPNLYKWTLEESGVQQNLPDMYKAVKDQYVRYLNHVLKNIGGAYRTPKGDDEPGDRFKPVPKELQERAIAFFDEQVFHAPLWLLDPSVMNKTTQPDGPNFVLDLQVRLLNSLLDISVLNKLMANTDQFGSENTLLVGDYVKNIHQRIWKPLSAPAIKLDRYQRDLQKAYVGALFEILLSKDPSVTENDAYSILWADLASLKTELQQASSKAGDALTKYHFDDLQFRIQNTTTIKR